MGQASEEPEGLDNIYGERKIRDGGEWREWRQAGPYFPWAEPRGVLLLSCSLWGHVDSEPGWASCRHSLLPPSSLTQPLGQE